MYISYPLENTLQIIKKDAIDLGKLLKDDFYFATKKNINRTMKI
jgi:hypothetical protein